MEKESEVIRENGSYRTVWNQCCLSLWVGQTQKSLESEMSWWIPRIWMQASCLQPPPPPPPPRGQAFSLHSSPWNSLRHLWHLDFWVWPTQELWQHCFHTVRKLPFSLMTSFSFSTLFPYCIAPAQHTFKYLTYTMIVGWTYFLFWYYIDVTTEIHIHVY